MTNAATEQHADPTVDFLNVAEAARELTLTRRAVVHRIKAGTLAATKIGEGRTSAYVIARSEIERSKAQQ